MTVIFMRTRKEKIMSSSERNCCTGENAGGNMVNYIQSCDDVKAAIITNSIGTAILSLLPGVGSRSAVNYGLVYISGLVYIKMLTNLFHVKVDEELCDWWLPDEHLQKIPGVTMLHSCSSRDRYTLSQPFNTQHQSAVEALKIGIKRVKRRMRHINSIGL